MTVRPLRRRRSRPTGRPTKLTAEVQARIVAAVRDGAPREDAALAAGISVHTFMQWVERGRVGKRRPTTPLYAQFAHAIEKADAESVVHAVAVVRKAIAEGQWVPAMTFLERKRPQHFGRRWQAEIAASDSQAPLRIVIETSPT